MSLYKSGNIVRSIGPFGAGPTTTRHFLIIKHAYIIGRDEQDDDNYRVWWIEGGREMTISLASAVQYTDEVVNE